ncbi:Stk1 family PASTA domain-containing Ser/Thr kinase [Paenibacillus agricola]|uniref:non-specific serine/threonine protein kinase n=1 Tax=Paenibacillus agricola TaxID=2716264 RepID=A0ABX0IXN4_9BACL|nr:Stk1 family PASTA domain-containing Ser/Thr kinase [Paenibacillus agricola]NHN28448.1 Stk1 family PASTA domain-containing Ser/Thr kinase [Paenibacillus agricola]
MRGTQLGGRYEILDRMGGGGMAIVYRAMDILLHRHVAVKVLRPQYVHDEEFIERFRREAQAAASLSHSNIVSIYDVGHEEEIHYIVMECIEGTTLNDLIKAKAPLQVEEAIRISSQICEALEHAHLNQIIHRDIKPHNILIGRNGRVKVTDFGIARAVTSSTITQTGSVMGSVHYFSPEHAKGTFTGEQSDLYSLGIVMYQMLTGRLPFIGESPISVALKHLQENVEDPRKVNPLIPQSVENVILRAVRKNPSDRYSSASQMLEDLDSCLEPGRRNEAKLMFKDIDELDEEKTRVIPAIRPGQYAPMHDDDEEDELGNSIHPTGISKKRIWIKPLVWVVVLLGLLGGMWYMVGYVKASMKVQEVQVPNVVNRPLSEARQMLKDAQLVDDVIYEESREVPKDVVISQSGSNMSLLIKSKVTLHVSKGIDVQKMPNLVSSNLADAKTALMVMGIKEDRIATEQIFGEKDPGTVLQQLPVPEAIIDPLKVTVKLTISKGKETFKMKDLVGLSEEAAKALITASKLKIETGGVTYEASYKQPKGRVIKQFPYEHEDEVSPGEVIKLVISSGLPEEAGPMTIKVPYAPATDGKATSITVTLTDAQYEEFDYKVIPNVTKAATAEVKLVVAPDKNAIIKVRQENELIELITVTYQDYVAQKNGKPFVVPTSGSPGATNPSTATPKPGTGTTAPGTTQGTTVPGGTPTTPTTPTAPGAGGTGNTGAGTGTKPGTTTPATSGGTTPNVPATGTPSTGAGTVPPSTGTGTTPAGAGGVTPTPASSIPADPASLKPANTTTTGGTN